MKDFLKRYWHWVLVTVLFVVLVLFVSDLTVVNLVKTRISVSRLHGEIERYRDQIREDSLFMEALKDDAFLEKYAREKHLMHSKDEQLFIIE
ncbi:MAG: septum formation initiator family protein [Tidjanibacter sp.]|nr:septum formation initiator family protein [Tidjanibacter sp.]